MLVLAGDAAKSAVRKTNNGKATGWCSTPTLLLICSSFRIGKMIIHFSFAHHDQHSPTKILIVERNILFSKPSSLGSIYYNLSFFQVFFDQSSSTKSCFCCVTSLGVFLSCFYHPSNLPRQQEKGATMLRQNHCKHNAPKNWKIGRNILWICP